MRSASALLEIEKGGNSTEQQLGPHAEHHACVCVSGSHECARNCMRDRVQGIVDGEAHANAQHNNCGCLCLRGPISNAVELGDGQREPGQHGGIFHNGDDDGGSDPSTASAGTLMTLRMRRGQQRGRDEHTSEDVSPATTATPR
jgi:hypothetical protein